MAFKLKTENPYSDRLIYLDKEITYLEAKLKQIRGRAHRN
jgi:hypothetical protein